MEYFNKFRATVTQVAAQVTNALPGNPLLREYEIGDQTCTAGPGFYWKVFKGVKKSTKKVVSVWLLDKKDVDRWPKEDRELFLSLIKHGVSQLTKLRHPRLLVVEHSIEESRDSLAFATESVFACLASCLIRREQASSTCVHLSDFTFSDVEIKHGLLQLGEALSFLHNDAGILHRNVTPECVVVNDRGAWKLAGFEFSVLGRVLSPGKFTYETFNWSERIPSISQPNLDYVAPEYVVGDGCDSFSDIYSLGVLSYAVYNDCRPPLEHKNDLERFRKNVEKLNSFQVPVESIPPVLLDDLKTCLKYLPDLRPDAVQFTKIAYFNDPLVRTLNLFESLIQMENSRKIHFFKSLPAVLAKFEKRVLLQKVLPFLSCEFSTPDLIPFILPSIFLIVEQATKEEFSRDILPQVIPLFSMEKPYQIALLLLQRMELLLEKASEEHVKCYVLPLVYNALSSDTMRIQELCISIVPNIGRLVDRNSMKSELLPKLLQLAISGSVLAVRVQSLVCIGKLLPTLESWMVTDLILPALPKVKSREPGVLMAILGIYKLIADCESVVVSREQWAKSALPFLIPICVENTLNLGQFEQFMAFIKSVIGIVEKDQRIRLQQLSAVQEQQMSVANFDDVMKSDSTVSNIDLTNFGDCFRRSDKYGIHINLDKDLSQNEKKLIASEQERTHGLLSQPSVQPAHSSLEWCSGVPTTVSNSSIGSVLFGESATQPSPSRFEMAPQSQNSGVVPALSNLDLSVFESATTGTPWSELGAVDGNQRNDCTFTSSCFSKGLPEPPKSTNAAVQRAYTSVERFSPLESLFSFPSKTNEDAEIKTSDTFLKSSLGSGGRTLDPVADFFM